MAKKVWESREWHHSRFAEYIYGFRAAQDTIISSKVQNAIIFGRDLDPKSEPYQLPAGVSADALEWGYSFPRVAHSPAFATTARPRLRPIAGRGIRSAVLYLMAGTRSLCNSAGGFFCKTPYRPTVEGALVCHKRVRPRHTTYRSVPACSIHALLNSLPATVFRYWTIQLTLISEEWPPPTFVKEALAECRTANLSEIRDST
jgi:hypothetical protein